MHYLFRHTNADIFSESMLTGFVTLVFTPSPQTYSTRADILLLTGLPVRNNTLPVYVPVDRSQWPRGLRRKLSSPARTLGHGFESHSMHGCLCAFILDLC
jgi:hypothetical protein